MPRPTTPGRGVESGRAGSGRGEAAAALSRSERLLKLATSVPGDRLVSLGTCFGKFTKTGKFRLHVTALDYLAPYAKVRPRGFARVCVCVCAGGMGGGVAPLSRNERATSLQ